MLMRQLESKIMRAWDESACGYQCTGRNTNISVIIMVQDGLSEMVIRCNYREAINTLQNQFW